MGKNCIAQQTAEVRAGKEAVLNDLTLTKRAFVKGWTDDSDVPRSFLKLILKLVTSKDSGQYTCTIVCYISSISSQTAVMRDSKYITACSKYTVICLMV